MSAKRNLPTNFGQEVRTLLSNSTMTQTSLALAIGKNPTHLNNVISGRYSRATSSWADLVANALDLPDEARYRLHLAAARDQGFKL